MSDPMSHWTQPRNAEEDLEEMPAPIVARRSTYVPAPRPAPMVDLMPADVTAVWTPSAGTISEIGTPTGRAWATVIRALPLIVFLLPVSAAGAWWLGARFYEFLIFYGLASIAAYLGALWLDLVHNSPGSVEMRRIDAASHLKERELELQHSLRRSALESYLQSLERD